MSALHRLRSVLRRHWIIAALVAAAVVLRIVVTLAYRPAMLYPDSVDYLARAARLTPSSWHPLGYSVFLRLVHWTGDVTSVVVTQHLMVLGDAVLLYALLVHLGVRRGLAALGAVPLLFDAYQLNIEQYVLSEALFETLLVVAFVLLLWQRRPDRWRCAAAGLLIAGAAVTRFDGAILIVPALVFLLVRRAGVWRVAVLLCAFVLPVVAYAGWYDAVNGQFTVSGLSGVFLYGRVISWVQCDGLHLPTYERPLCPTAPPRDRPPPTWYVSAATSPARELVGHDGRSPNSILTSFDLTVIRHQPLDYLNHTLDDYLRQFLPTHVDPVNDTESETRFQLGYPSSAVSGIANPGAVIATFTGGPPPSANRSLDRLLVDYQRVVYTWGPLLAGALVLWACAVAGAGPARRSGRRAECLALGLGGVLVFGFSTASAIFGWRYQLPTLVFIPPAGVLALAMLFPTLRAEPGTYGTRRPAHAPRREPEAVEIPENAGDPDEARPEAATV